MSIEVQIIGLTMGVLITLFFWFIPMYFILQLLYKGKQFKNRFYQLIKS